MGVNHSLWSFFANAGPVVKVVMLILLAASILSWSLIIQRGFFLKKMQKIAHLFEEKFWTGTDLNRLYVNISAKNDNDEPLGLARIFEMGYREYTHLRQGHYEPDRIMQGVERAMTAAESRELDKIERNLTVLATIGSTSPYVGLFGTVWGIMTAFQALGQVQQATIAMVAPGISEALIATAMGLFAAIPAVIAYNRYTSFIDRLANQYATFKDEFANLLFRQVNHPNSTAVNTEEVAHG